MYRTSIYEEIVCHFSGLIINVCSINCKKLYFWYLLPLLMKVSAFKFCPMLEESRCFHCSWAAKFNKLVCLLYLFVFWSEKYLKLFLSNRMHLISIFWGTQVTRSLSQPHFSHKTLAFPEENNLWEKMHPITCRLLHIHAKPPETRPTSRISSML